GTQSRRNPDRTDGTSIILGVTVLRRRYWPRAVPRPLHLIRPPLKWSALEYGFRPEEERYGEEEAQAGGGRRQVAPGRCVALAGQDGRGGDPLDWSDGGHLLPLAPGVWWAEVGSGEAAEGPGDREQPSSSGHCRSDAG